MKTDNIKIKYTAFLLLIFLLIWAVWANKALMITNMSITSPKIPAAFSGFKIVQISDLHNANFGENNEKLIGKIKECEPDIIVVTGDVIDSRRTDIDIAIAFMKDAVNIAPVYYVNGNHEARISEYGYMKAEFEKLGVTVLENEAVALTTGNEEITLMGVTDPAFDTGGGFFDEAESVGNMTKNIEALKGEGYNILLSHRPEYFDVYVNTDADLIFTGHAHGGQFRLPFVGGLFAPGQGFFPEYDSGLYTEGSTNMIVSRGIGNSAFPLRINNRPEIISVELVAE